MKKKKTNKFGKFFSIILLIVSVLFIGLFYYSNMIPLKYLLPSSIIVGLFDFALFCLIRKKRLRKIPFLLSILTIILEGLASYYLLVTLGFLSGIWFYDYKTHTYDVIVLKDNYNKITQLDKKNIYYYDDKESSTKKAVKELENKIKFDKEAIDDIDDLLDDLFSEEADAIILEDSKFNIITEEQPNILKDVDIIDTISVKTKLKSDKTDNKDILKEPFNIYITGNDSYGKVTDAGRSDVNLVATINVKEGKILVTSIPRDYYVTLAGKNAKDKLTHAGIYGIDSSIKTIEDLLDTKIDYYLKVNFTSVEDIVDVLGGITVNCNYDFTSYEGYHFNKGENDLNGKEALAFVRERYAFDGMGGDRIRGEHQVSVIKELVRKVTTPKILAKYESLLSSVEGKFTTNFSEKNIAKLVKNQLNKKTKWTVENYNLEGTDSRGTTYSYPSKSLYVMEPKQDSVAKAKENIKEYLNEEQ